MTHSALPSDRFAERDFRIGHVVNRAFSVLSRNFVPFFAINAVAVLPALLLEGMSGGAGAPSPQSIGLAPGGVLTFVVTMLLTMVLSALSQAVVLYGAFQDMLGRPVSIGESLQVGFSRFFPIIGVAICVGILAALASILLVFPGLMLFMMWFVAPPACVVERLGPLDSMSRSRVLTKGHRWPIFGIWLMLIIVSGVVGIVINLALARTAGPIPAFVGALIWRAVLSAFLSIFVVVTYHDLRVAKEGVDTEQIAAVFD